MKLIAHVLRYLLTCRRQSVWIGNRTGASMITNISSQPTCLSATKCYNVYTHDSVTSHKDNDIQKFANEGKETSSED